MKTWMDRVRKVYDSLEELRAYDRTWGVVRRCGYRSVKRMWRCNPVIGGSVDPADFGRTTPAERRRLSAC